MSLVYTDAHIKSLRTIQRAWRRYIVNETICYRSHPSISSFKDVQVFRFYRDLIHFHNNGDPQILMRTINPNEAKFIDAASGIRIRFRLAGASFPPTIHYKVFTNRPIQDLGATAPRDYTRPCLKLKTAADANNKLDRFPQPGLFSHLTS